MLKNTIYIWLAIFVVISNFEIVQAETQGTEFRDYTKETLNEVITWGVGLSGGASLLLCKRVPKTSPLPLSFYSFNSASVAYFVLETIISDEDESKVKSIANRDYGGANDEQMNSYLRSRDIAEVNMKYAKKKAVYKKAFSVAMLASAALAYREASIYEAKVKASKVNVKGLCSSSAGQAAAQFTKLRCNNVGGAKVVCSKIDGDKLKNLYNHCKNSAAKIAIDKSCSVAINNGYGALKTAELRQSSAEVKESDLFYSEKENKKLELVKSATDGSIIDGIDRSGYLINNPVSKLLTLGGMQYTPEQRMKLYGLLGGLVSLNAFFNQEAAKRYERERDYYQSLIDNMNKCEGECHTEEGSSGDYGSDVGNDTGTDTGTGTDTETNFEVENENEEYKELFIEPKNVGVFYVNKTQQFTVYGKNSTGQFEDVSTKVDWYVEEFPFEIQTIPAAGTVSVDENGLATALKDWGRVKIAACYPKGCYPKSERDPSLKVSSTRTSMTIIVTSSWAPNTTCASPPAVRYYEVTEKMSNVQIKSNGVHFKITPGNTFEGGWARLWAFWSRDGGKTWTSSGWDFTSNNATMKVATGYGGSGANKDHWVGQMISTICDQDRCPKDPHACNGRKRSNIIFVSN